MRRQNITPRIDMGRHSAPLVQQIQEVQVKKIGILGGMSAASTQIYYQTLCSLTQSELGCLHSPNLLIRSVDFAPLALHMNDGNWSAICDTLHAEAKLLAAGGAELIVLATSTMHKLKDQIMQSIDLPFIHIAEATATAVLTGGSKRPAFFATKFTMQEAFYLDILRDNGLDPIVLNTTEQDVINDIIFTSCAKTSPQLKVKLPIWTF
jgi:aspartate racemase